MTESCAFKRYGGVTKLWNKIIGHTDSSGDAAKNLALSKERAVAVKNYLINKSIAVERLSVEGLGSNKPVADNATADGRKKNRRIEFDVI